MRENVMNLEVVLADGRIINTAGEGRRTRYVDLQCKNLNCRIIIINSMLFMCQCQMVIKKIMVMVAHAMT